MRSQVDEQFRAEVDRFRLHFTCEDCAHFDPERDACAEGYPNEAHRERDLERHEILFCKLFEGA